jgi:biotin transport system ATP-binding protein
VAFGPNNLSLGKKVINQRVQDALQQVGLTDLADKPPYLLSGGEKRRLAIAGVLAMNSCVIMFDEPFSNLDYPGTRQVLQQMGRLHKNGHTVIVATHELDAILELATRLIIMQKGKIVRAGLPQDIAGDAFQFDIKIPDRYQADNGSKQWLS